MATTNRKHGVIIGTDVQAFDAGLNDISGLPVSDGNIIVGDNSNWVAESGNTARTSLGLGTGDSPTFTGVTVSSGGDVSFSGSGEPTGLPSIPGGATAAVSKAFFDSQSIKGAITKANAIIATTGNITLSGEQTIDGVLTSVDRILVKSQTDPTENGIYLSAAGAWARTEDLDNSPSAEIFNGVWTFVTSGTANTGLSFRITSTGTGTDDVHTIGVDNIDWAEQAIDVVPGDGIDKVGSTVSVDFNTTNLKITSTEINTIQDIDSAAKPSFAGVTATDTIDETHGSDIASAATTNLETATGNIVDVTGTTTITAITLSEGHQRLVRFTGALTLTNGASLVLPSGDNILTAVGDYATFTGYTSGVVRVSNYEKADGTAIIGGAANFDSSFDSTTSWGAASGGLYTITITAATHGFGQNVSNIILYETVTGDSVKVSANTALFDNSTGDVSFDVSETPDGRFAGKVIIQGEISTSGEFYNILQEEGSSLTQRPTVNYIGDALTATDNLGSNRTDVTIGRVLPFTDSLVALGNQTTTSGTYADVVNSSKIVSFPNDTENIMLNFNIGHFSTAIGTIMDVRAVIDATFSSPFKYVYNTANVHFETSGSIIFEGPFSGSLTVKLEIRRVSGVGTITLDSNDNVNWSLLGFS